MMHLLRICWHYFKLKLIQTLSFRAALYTELIAGLGCTVAMFAFWQVLYLRIPTIAGWTMGDMLLFMFFLELFWGISRGIFGVTRYFWQAINQGQIDKYLCRPLDARLGLILHTLEPTVLLRSLVLGGVWLLAAIHAGVSSTGPLLLAGIVATGFGVLVYVEFSLTINYLAFRWGNTAALDELLGGFWELLRYPLDLLPLLIRRVFTFCVPALLAATLPALIATGRAPLGASMLGIVCTWGIWHLIQTYAWRKGLHHYESCGG